MQKIQLDDPNDRVSSSVSCRYRYDHTWKVGGGGGGGSMETLENIESVLNIIRSCLPDENNFSSSLFKSSKGPVEALKPLYNAYSLIPTYTLF